MKRTYQKWTPEEERILRVCVGSREPVGATAKRLGRSEASIARKKTELELFAKRLSTKNPLHFAEIVKFKMAGWTLERIAEVWGANKSSISRVLTINGFYQFLHICPRSKRLRKSWTEIEMVLLRKYLKKGYALTQIRYEFPGRTEKALKRKIYSITRYWLSEAEQAERKRMRKKQLRVY